jgi:hypothetical protein
MPSKSWWKLEEILMSEVDGEIARRIRSVVGQVVRDETKESDDLAKRARELATSRDSVLLYATGKPSQNEMDALCVAVGNAVGGPSEVDLVSLLRKLDPDHSVLSALDSLDRQRKREALMSSIGRVVDSRR